MKQCKYLLFVFLMYPVMTKQPFCELDHMQYIWHILAIYPPMYKIFKNISWYILDLNMTETANPHHN